MARFRKHPTGEWPFYPRLEEGDIEHEYWNTKKGYHEAFMSDRKGRVVVLFENEKYDAFLDKVKKRKGNIWHTTIDAAMKEALDEWVAKED